MRTPDHMSLSPLIIFIVTLFAYPAHAATLHVPADQPTIQAGIDTAADGDTVLVAAGSYLEKIDFLGKAITVRSEAESEGTAIFGFGHIEDGSVVTFANNEPEEAILDGFILSYGDVCGICCIGSSPTITNCTISRNSARIEACDYTSRGGGIYINEESSPTITNCTISENEANYGGGIYCRSSSATIRNCMIVGNEVFPGAYSGGDGAGIYFDNASPTITDCTITGNSAYGAGAGIYCDNHASPSIINCTISANSTYYGSGGGIHCATETSPTIMDCVIKENSSRGISCSSSSPTIMNCMIMENSYSGIRCNHSDAAIVNCRITGNITEGYGGGMHFTEDSFPTITNCVITENHAGMGGGIYSSLSSPTVIYSTFSNTTATFQF